MANNNGTTLFTNGRVFSHGTSNADFQTSLVVKDGKIAYVGAADTPEIQAHISNGVTTQDLNGRYILPGFIDGHCHFLLLGQSLNKVDLDGCENLDDIRARISKYAKENPDKKRILCRGWMYSTTNNEAKASMLDDLDPRPIFIDAKDLHSTWCNTAALEEMGIQDMETPAGGTIERDENGKASGRLTEAAVFLIVWPHIANVLSMQEKVASLKAGMEAYHQVGYTGCIDMAMDENAWEAILALRESERHLPMRIAAYWAILPGTGVEHRLKQVERAIELSKQYSSTTSPDLRVIGIKLITDGVIDACAAALKEPYSTNFSNAEPIWTPEMLDPVVQKACEANLQCAVHAIGDLAIRNAIDVLEKHGKPNQRHRIEHLELTSPGDAERLGKLGIVASIQPVHADPAILRAWPKLLGPERLKRAFAYKEFADHGVVLALGSDSPTAPHDVLKNLYVATTRKSARQPDAGDAPVNENFKIGIAEAITGATHGVAYSYFNEGSTGSLETGKYADFVVVDMQYEPGELLKGQVLETWFEGKKVYQA